MDIDETMKELAPQINKGFKDYSEWLAGLKDDGNEPLAGLGDMFIGTKEDFEKKGTKGLYRIDMTDGEKNCVKHRDGYAVTGVIEFEEPKPAISDLILRRVYEWHDGMTMHEMVRCKIYQTVYALMIEKEGLKGIDYRTGEPFWKYWDMLAKERPEINEYKDIETE